MSDRPAQPRYVDASGDPRNGSLPVRPPFQFSGVTSRVFPLRADMALLSNFCDQYLNMDIPGEIVQFRPALPYVYLMVLDYGSMSSASLHAQNVGWVAQHEVAFSVPLQRWRLEGGEWVFKDWACVSPFIFVDDEMSLATGREVYGWPKVSGVVEATRPLWDRHPMAGTRMLTFSTHVFTRAYAGENETLRVLLQIDADAPPTYSEFPPDAGNPWSPWLAMAQAARSSMTLAGSALDMTLALRARGYRTRRNLKTLRAMGGKAADYLMAMGPDLMDALRKDRRARAIDGNQREPALKFDNITLKQFRDAQEPDLACYQALIRSSMGIERINGAGLLGDVNLLRGDISGGYAIRVHRYATQPIIEALGIEVAATEQTGDGVPVSVLKPVLPFWTDVDLYYGAGEALCARTHTHDDDGSDPWVDAQPPANAAAGAAPAPSSSGAPAPGEGHSPYNTALGAAEQAMSGPFDFPDVTLQVYPLMADADQLAVLIDQMLNEPLKGSGLSFEPIGSYAYLLVQVTGDQLGSMWSGTNNLGGWAEREVSFTVPVRWYRQQADGTRELVSIGLVAPFVYASNGRAVITDREVNGRPTVQATISSPSDPWLESSGPDKPRHYLDLATEVFPSLGYGQRAESRTLLHVDGDDVLPYNDNVGWRQVADHWGSVLVQDLARKTLIGRELAQEVADARALALELLAHGEPFNTFNLKQYRDAAEVQNACYQALVHGTRRITRIYDVREIENRVHVRLHRYPGHPIVDALGLKVKSLDSREGQVVQNLQPVRPFWMRISVQDNLATVAAVRRPEGGWQIAHPWLGAAAAGGVTARSYLAHTAPHTRVSPHWPAGPQRLQHHAQAALRARLLERLSEAGQPPVGTSGLESRPLEELIALEAALAPAGADDPRLARDRARALLEGLPEVQVVIESILSREWEHWGNPRWYRHLEPKPDHVLPVGCLGMYEKELGLTAQNERPRPNVARSRAVSVTEDDGVAPDWFVLPEPPQQ